MRWWLFAMVVGWASGAWAGNGTLLQPGDLFTTELSGGSVVNLRGGGDFTGLPRFATGLSDPAGICLGPGGEIYVSENASGEVTIITKGGDFNAATPFAFGFDGPEGLACSDSQILLYDAAAGEIFDITGGGDFTLVMPFALTSPSSDGSLFRDSSGTLWVASGSEIFDGTAGGDLPSQTSFAESVTIAGLGEWNGRLLAGDPDASAILDFTGGGNVSANVFASLGLNTPSGLLGVPGLGLLMHTDDLVLEISAGGDQSLTPPFASGLDTGTFGQFVYIEGCGDGIVQDAEDCDDGNTIDDDACNNACELVMAPGCPTAPVNGCFTASKGKLLVNEKREGKEKVKAVLKAFSGSTFPDDFGDPAAGDTRLDACLYDAMGNLVLALPVDRGSDTCGPKAKPCWKATKPGFQYRDKATESAGVDKITLKSNPSSRDTISVSAKNKANKGLANLMTGVALQLTSSQGATVQVFASGASCFGLDLGTVKKNDADLFKAKAP